MINYNGIFFNNLIYQINPMSTYTLIRITPIEDPSNKIENLYIPPIPLRACPINKRIKNVRADASR